MNEWKVNTTKNLTCPSGVHGLIVTHEWGDTVVNPVDSGNNVTFTIQLDSIGIHKFQWYGDDKTCDGTQETYGAPFFYQVYAPIFSISQLIDEQPELADFEDQLPAAERQIRHVIQNYTGQKFGFYANKTMAIQGNGGDSLFLPVPLRRIYSIENSYGDDITTMVEISPNEPTIIQRANRFRGAHYYETKRDVFWNTYELFNERYNFDILGDWGYEYVPQEVTEAAGLLLEDMFAGGEAAQMRSQGITRLQLGDFEIFANADMWGSTGNSKADNLLASYVTLGIGLV